MVSMDHHFEDLKKELAEVREQLAVALLDIQLLKTGKADNNGSTAGESSKMTEEADASTDFINEQVHAPSSMWDAGALIGVCPGAAAGAAYTALLFVIQLALSAVFIMVCWTYFRENPYDAEARDAIANWRTTVGHDMRYYNDMDGTSLVSRVCSQQASLNVAGTQVGLLGDISDYLNEGSLVSGPVMCVVACIFWFISVAKEIDNSLGFAGAYVALPTEHTAVDVFNGGCTLRCMSAARKVWVIQLAMARITIAGLIWYVGMYWLIHTYSVSDLLLNCVALQFVLDVDEFLLGTLAPMAMQNFLGSVAALPVPLGRFHLKGLDLRALMMMLGVAIFMIPQVVEMSVSMGQLRDTQIELCGGKQNFVQFLSTSGVVVYAETTDLDDAEAYTAPPYGPIPDLDGAFDASQLYATDAVRSLVTKGSDGITSIAIKSNGLVGPRYSLAFWQEASSKDIGALLNPSCIDLVSNSTAFQAMLRSLVAEKTNSTYDDVSVRSCADVANYCLDDGTLAQRTRMLCPDTCACNTPLSKMALTRPQDGCSSTCSTSKRWNDALSDSDCSDHDGSKAWQNYIEQIREVTQDWYNSSLWQGVADELESGCTRGRINVRKTYQMDICDDTWPFRSTAIFCPVTCGCDDKATFDPTKCSRRCIDATQSSTGTNVGSSKAGGSTTSSIPPTVTGGSSSQRGTGANNTGSGGNNTRKRSSR